jgi:hypothetical protein
VYTFYLNGVPNGTTSTGPATAANGPLLFGINKTLTSQQFTGKLSDFTVWNRALTASEMWSLFDPPTRWQLRYKVGRRTWFLGRSVSVADTFPAYRYRSLQYEVLEEEIINT